MLGAPYQTVRSCIDREKMRWIQQGKRLEKGTNTEAPCINSIPKQAGNIRDTILCALSKPGGINKELFCKANGVNVRALDFIIDGLVEEGFSVDSTGNGFHLRKTANTEPEVVVVPWNGDRIIRFGLLGDTQINSKYTQLTHLHTAYETFKREGISKVYHTGDIDDGEQMRPGHQYECYNQGADDHVAEIVRVYPKISGIDTDFITGNHDHSLLKLAGYDIGKAIANARPDLKCIGQSQAYVNLTPNCLLELRHPGDGTAYAKSYKIQKMIEAMSGGEKPHLLAVGHYHKYNQDFYRNVHAKQTACLQAQTPWMRGRGIAAEMGFLIVELIVSDEGHIERDKTEFFPFYKAIKDDYKNFR
jgi:hypothetical protein